MDIPKEPDDRRDWSSIDIFVFCNGQENEPPRKYHLQSEELNMWVSTLSCLATSQYGCEISEMHLYTIDGKMIGGPLELEHGVNYVAVVPPDEFIQTDYHTYLMKASRSWQKRQKQKLYGNNESLQDMNTNVKTNSFLLTENKFGEEKELSNVEFSKNIKSKANSAQNDSANNNQKQNNRSIVNNRNKSKEENSKLHHQAIKKNNNQINGRNNKITKQNNLQLPPKGTLKTKIPFKNSSVLNYKNISKAKTEDYMKNVPNRKVSSKLSLEKMIGKIKTEDVTESNFHFSPSLKVMLSEESNKSENKSLVKSANTKQNSRLHEHTTSGKDTRQNTQHRNTKDISIKRGGIVNFKSFIRVNDYEVPNDTNNNFKLKIIPSNISFVTEKASQVNIDFDINVSIINKLYNKDERNPDLIYLSSIDDQIYDSNISDRKQNNDTKLFVLAAERDDDKFKWSDKCKCDDEDKQWKHPDTIATLQSESTTVDTDTVTTTELYSEVEPRGDLLSTELQKNLIVFDKYTQTEWSDTLLEARRHQDGFYTLHLPPLAVIKNL